MYGIMINVKTTVTTNTSKLQEIGCQMEQSNWPILSQLAQLLSLLSQVTHYNIRRWHWQRPSQLVTSLTFCLNYHRLGPSGGTKHLKTRQPVIHVASNGLLQSHGSYSLKQPPYSLSMIVVIIHSTLLWYYCIVLHCLFQNDDWVSILNQ